MSKKETTTQGFGIFTVIGIVFIVLKLVGATKVATWSWLWVLAPFWVPVAVGCAIIFAILAFLFIAELLQRR